MSAHSKVGASSMDRWRNCPGSVRFIEEHGLKSIAGEAAAEGSVAHSIAEMRLLGTPVPKLGTVIEHEGHAITVDKAMLGHTLEYKAIVDEIRGKKAELHVEHKFHINKLHEALFGTADAVIWHEGSQRLDVIDFKYGAGLPVEATDNVQLRYYAVGAMMTLGYKPKTIDVHIIQPRCEHPEGPHRTASYTALDLLEFAAEMVDAVKATEAPDAPLKPGYWCRKSFCPAAGICPAQKDLAQDLAKTAFGGPKAYDPEELSATLDWLPVLEGWVKSVREFAYEQAEQGNCPPRYKLVEKRATEKWSADATPQAVAKAFGLDLAEITSEPKLNTPAQVRKLVPGKNDRERKEALSAFTITESSGHTLVHEDDNRPSVASAKDVFSNA